jgi:CheY-like chemotaxis protein
MPTSTSRSVPTLTPTLPTTESKRILLVEDSDTTRLTHRIMISKRTSHVVDSVGDGEAALRWAVEHKPDLILMDMVMPGMDGLEVCRALKREPATASIPVVLLTFRATEELTLQCRAAGCRDVLKKPIAVDDLIGTVSQILSR